MKKLLITTGILIIYLNGFNQTQILNPSFETWNDSLDVDQWWTWNTIRNYESLSVNQTAFKSTDAIDGSYSIKINTDSCNNCVSKGYSNPLPGQLQQFFPYNGIVADSISFYYKYFPTQNTDTASFGISYYGNGILKANANFLISSNSIWTKKTLAINALQSGVIDTLSISFLSSSNFFGNVGTDNIGSTLYIDKIELIYNSTTSINNLQENNSFSLFPNPITTEVTLLCMENINNAEINIYSLSGKKVLTKKITSQHNTINLNFLEKGVYIFVCSNENKRSTAKIIKQ